MENNHLDVHYIFSSTFKHQQTRGLAYVLSKRLSEGHICLDTSVYNQDEDIKAENPFWKEEFDVFNINELTDEVGNNKPIITHGNLIYLNKYYRYETLLIDRIKELKNGIEFKETDVLEKSISQLFVPQPEIDWQLIAAIVAVTTSFSIITGGPGTGKTTTVAKVLSMLYALNKKLKVGLAAPTGKAAARMNESLAQAKEKLNLDEEIKNQFDNIQASTIHRMLGYKHGSVEFRHDAENHLPFDVVIVDESSMIDVAMMSKLMKAIATGAKLILLGDKNQLSSVEAGSVFGDLCQSLGKDINHFSEQKSSFIKGIVNVSVPKQSKESLLSDCIVELQKSHRFNGDIGIGRFSKDVINGLVPDYDACENKGEDKDLVIVQDDTESSFFVDLLSGYEAYIKELDIRKSLDKFNQVRVLCATRDGDAGVYSLNLKIEQFLKQKKLLNPSDTFYENQPVMIKKNNALLGLFNGDIGIIRKDQNGVLKAFFEVDDAIKEIHIGYLTNVETVFAMTIHKSQGSEFRDVIVCLPEDKEMPILTRELLYTAVTRAKERALVVGRKEVVESTIARKVERASGIQQRVIKK